MIIIFFIKVFILRICWFFFKFSNKNYNHIDCDLIIISHKKDYETLKKNIFKNINNINNSIGKIFIVGSTKAPIEIKELDYKYIYEENLSIVKKNKFLIKGAQKGWILQQLIKLSMDAYSKRYICIDSDTLLLRKINFFKGNNPIFYLSNELGLEYKKFERSIKLKTSVIKVFIVHMMVFESFALKQFKNYIKKMTNKEWDKYIIDFSNDNKMGFSEYNSYANFYYQKFPSNLGFIYNKTMSLNDLNKSYHENFRYNCDTVSFHQNEFRK